jgi:PAT family beta-lactamase induction signal transducer AmpG
MKSMSSSNERIKKLALFTAVYFVEGTVLTYFSSFNILYLRSYNLSYSLIGIISAIAMIPLVLKILIGYLSDRVSLFKKGHRKPYILIGLLLQTTAFLCVPFFNPKTQFSGYMIMIILAALGMSTYDTTTDGLSIDSTPEKDRGLVQGLMVGGRALSAVVTAALMGLFSSQGHWTYTFYMIAVLALPALILAFLVKDQGERAPETEYSREAFHSFKNPTFLLFVLLGMIYPLALYSSEGMISAYLNEGLKINLATVGLYTSVFGIGTVVGGITGGSLMKKFGRRASLLSAVLITAAATFLLAVTKSALLMWGIIFFMGFVFGDYETVYFAMGMDFADPRIAAFMFSVTMSVGNIGIAVGSSVAGILVDSVGFTWMFVIFGLVHLATLPLVFAIFKPKRAALPAV